MELRVVDLQKVCRFSQGLGKKVVIFRKFGGVHRVHNVIWIGPMWACHGLPVGKVWKVWKVGIRKRYPLLLHYFSNTCNSFRENTVSNVTFEKLGNPSNPSDSYRSLEQLGGSLKTIYMKLFFLKRYDVWNKRIPLYGLETPLHFGVEFPMSPRVFWLFERHEYLKTFSEPCKLYGLRTPVWGYHGIPKNAWKIWKFLKAGKCYFQHYRHSMYDRYTFKPLIRLQCIENERRR